MGQKTEKTVEIVKMTPTSDEASFIGRYGEDIVRDHRGSELVSFMQR